MKYKKPVVVIAVILLGIAAVLSQNAIWAKQKVKISQSKLSMTTGDSQKLKLNGVGKKNQAKISWKTSDSGVASVTPKGKVTAKSAGKAVITARFKKKNYRCTVQVAEKQAENQNPDADDASKPDTDVTPNPDGNQNMGTKGGSTVYFTADISSKGLMAVYEALGWKPQGKAAVKLSTGEPPASNYLDPELMKELVQSVDASIVECNTAYGGSRAETAMHMQVAKDHGFTAIADVDILDMAGFGGAVKNISIGLGSQEGKCLIHTAGKSHTSPWGGDQTGFTESMAEAGKSVSDYLGNGERIVYINVLNNISIDCDCDGNPAKPDIHDIGIVASTDPVAADQACIDLAFAAEGSASLRERVNSRNGLHTLEYAEKIGLGSRTYQLVNIDN